MITRDSLGIIITNVSKDGGDSANRSGLAALFMDHEPLELFEPSKDGHLVRHPTQVPWNNWKNFSRDQTICYMAGARKQNEPNVRRIFWKYASRLFFAPNIDRDALGTTKYPWPNYYTNDAGVRTFTWFQFADPLFPDAIWHMILCAKIWPLYWYAPIGWLWLIISIFVHGKLTKTNDEGQIIAQAITSGKFFVWFYKFCKPAWKDALYQYWVIGQNQQEISDAIIKGIG